MSIQSGELEKSSYEILTDIIVVDNNFIISPAEFKKHLIPVIYDNWQEVAPSYERKYGCYHLTNEIVDATFKDPAKYLAEAVANLAS
jgi:hypothetical protein